IRWPPQLRWSSAVHGRLSTWNRCTKSSPLKKHPSTGQYTTAASATGSRWQSHATAALLGFGPEGRSHVASAVCARIAKPGFYRVYDGEVESHLDSPLVGPLCGPSMTARRHGGFGAGGGRGRRARGSVRPQLSEAHAHEERAPGPRDIRPAPARSGTG